jgi:hypothetical protein
VNPAVLSGTRNPVPAGTRFPCHPEPKKVISLCFHSRNQAPSNYTNLESYGFYLTEEVFQQPRSEFALSARIARIIATRAVTPYHARTAFASFFHAHPRSSRHVTVHGAKTPVSDLNRSQKNAREKLTGLSGVISPGRSTSHRETRCAGHGGIP